MPRKSILTVTVTILVVTLCHLAPRQSSAQTAAAVALTGVVTSQEEGSMEGVVMGPTSPSQW